MNTCKFYLFFKYSN